MQTMENPGGDGSSRGSRKYLANKFGRAVDTYLDDYNPDKYIDDENMYLPRIHREKVDAYNAFAMDQAHVEYEKSLKIQKFRRTDSSLRPSFRELFISSLLSMHWDRFYIILFTIWCILYGVTLDEYFMNLSYYNSTVKVSQSQILLFISILPILMLIAALIPCFTVCLTMLTCHHTLKKASIRTMQRWSIVAIFLSQFIEFNSHEFKPLFQFLKKNRIQPLPTAQHPLVPQPDVEANGPEGSAADPLENTEHAAHRDVHRVSDDVEYHRRSDEGDQQRQSPSNTVENVGDVVDNSSKRLTEKSTFGLLHHDMNESDLDAEVNKLYPKSMFIETGEFVAGLRQALEEQQGHDEIQRKLKLQMRRKQALLKDPRLKEWTCVTCNRFNSEPVHGYHDEDVFVVEGDEVCPRVFMKQMEHSTLKPICAHCMTPYDYIPPDCSRHLFPQKGNKITAFANYPIPHHHRTEVNVGTTLYQRIKRLIRPNILQKIQFRLPMDWRLPLYISSQLPEPLRYEIQGSSFLLGEVIECRVQKLEWTKASIVKDHSDGFFDICYESGEEVGVIWLLLTFIC